MLLTGFGDRRPNGLCGMNESVIIQRLHGFERQHVLPLLSDIKAEAICRNDFELTLLPGSIAFLVNNADAYEIHGGRFYWQALSVLYDDGNRKGEVFNLHACYDGRADAGYFACAGINGILQLIRKNDRIVWRNPLDGKRLLSFPNDEPDKLLRNAWYVFRGAILPLLYVQSYRFASKQADAVVFQAQMLRQIATVYKDLL